MLWLANVQSLWEQVELIGNYLYIQNREEGVML